MEVGSGAILIPTRIALDPRHRHDVEKGVSLRTAHRLLSLGALLTASAALAQIATSTLTGTVIDTSTRAPVPDVVVTATLPSLQGEQVVVTDASGLYRVPQPIYTPIENSQQRRFGDERSINFIGKLTYLISSDHRVSLSAFGTPTWGGGNGSSSGRGSIRTSRSAACLTRGSSSCPTPIRPRSRESVSSRSRSPP